MIAPNNPETLADYFEQRYKPEFLTDRHAKTVRHWEQAVRLFLRFANGEALLSSINPDCIDAFETWCRKHAVWAWTAAKHANRIRSIVSASRPSLTRTWRECVNLIAEAEASEGSLRHYFETLYVASHDLAAATIKRYQITIRSLDQWYGREVMLSDLCDDLTNGYLSALLDTNFSKQTVARKQGDILALWRSAINDGLVKVAPLQIQRIKVSTVVSQPWTLEQIVKLVEASESQALDEYTTIMGDNRSLMFHRGKLLKAYLLVGWDTGLWRGDMLLLKRSDIQDSGRIEMVQSKTPAIHVCMVRSETIAAVDDTFLEPRERIFEVRPCWINEWFRVLCSIAELPWGRGGTYKLRRASGWHVEAIMPGAGPGHLGYAPHRVFGQHYDDLSVRRAEPTLPPPIPGYQAEANGNANGNNKPAALPPPLPGQQ